MYQLVARLVVPVTALALFEALTRFPFRVYTQLFLVDANAMQDIWVIFLQPGPFLFIASMVPPLPTTIARPLAAPLDPWGW